MAQMTYNLQLTSKADRMGRRSVMVRLHLKGQPPGRVLTSVKIVDPKKNWNPKKTWSKWIVRHPDKERLNQEIEEEYYRIKRQVEAWQKAEPDTMFTPALLADRFRNGTSEYYFDWINKALEDAKEQTYCTYLGKKSAASLFKEFAGKDTLLQSVSPALVRRFQDWLRRKPTSQNTKRKGSTTNKIIQRLNVLHELVLVKTGHSPKRAKLLSPWMDVTSVDEVKPKKDKLITSVIEQISKVDTTPTRKRMLPCADAFRIWQLSLSLAGARFSDVIKLRYSEFEVSETGEPIHLRYEMMKTGASISIPVFDEARAILKHYWRADAKQTDFVLPYLDNKASYAKLLTHEQYKDADFKTKAEYYNRLMSWNIKTNQGLKVIQEKAAIKEKLTCHTSRHSFADLARRIMETDNTINLYDIQKILGHGDIKTTQIYTRDLQERDTTKAMNAIFNRNRE